MLSPLGLVGAASAFACEAVTRSLETNRELGVADVLIERREGGSALVSVKPRVALPPPTAAHVRPL